MAEPLLHIETETEDNVALLNHFIGLSALNPDAMLWAIKTTATGDHHVPRDQLSSDVLTAVRSLLDVTDDGFEIDYRQDFLKAVVREDGEYLARINALQRTETGTPERRLALRAIALRGLALFVEAQASHTYGAA